jgi:tubulin-specific chaperone D
MDAPEDRDLKLQKASGDLLLQFRNGLPDLLYSVPDTPEAVRPTVDRRKVDRLISLV